MPEQDETLAEGRYQLLEVIGSGGMATVYRALDERLQVTRAIKVLSSAFSGKPRIRARFEAEARTMAILDHSNIVRVYDVGSQGDTVYIVMELVEGQTLLQRIEQAGPLEPSEALEITRSVLDGLRAAHSQGVVHRDIKPHNILLSIDGRVRLTDFGIASSTHLTEESFTKTGAVMGTWAFMAPEQRVNSKGVDRRADLYGVGATLFAMVTQRTPMDLFAADLDPVMLRDVPASVLPLIKTSTRYQPDERYQDAGAMMVAVENGLAASPTRPSTLRTPSPTPTPTPPPGQAHPLPTAEATFLPDAGLGMLMPEATPPAATMAPPPPPPPSGQEEETPVETPDVGLDSGTLLPEDEIEQVIPDPERVHLNRMFIGIMVMLAMFAIGAVGMLVKKQADPSPPSQDPPQVTTAKNTPVPARPSSNQTSQNRKERHRKEKEEEDKDKDPQELSDKPLAPPAPPIPTDSIGVSPGLSLVPRAPGKASVGEKITFSGSMPAASSKEHEGYTVRLSYRAIGGPFQRPRTMRRQGKTWRTSFVLTEDFAKGVEWCMFAKPDPAKLPRHPKLTAVSCQSPRRVRVQGR